MIALWEKRLDSVDCSLMFNLNSIFELIVWLKMWSQSKRLMSNSHLNRRFKHKSNKRSNNDEIIVVDTYEKKKNIDRSAFCLNFQQISWNESIMLKNTSLHVCVCVESFRFKFFWTRNNKIGYSAEKIYHKKIVAVVFCNETNEVQKLQQQHEKRQRTWNQNKISNYHCRPPKQNGPNIIFFPLFFRK